MWEWKNVDACRRKQKKKWVTEMERQRVQKDIKSCVAEYLIMNKYYCTLLNTLFILPQINLKQNNVCI